MRSLCRIDSVKCPGTASLSEIPRSCRIAFYARRALAEAVVVVVVGTFVEAAVVGTFVTALIADAVVAIETSAASVASQNSNFPDQSRPPDRRS